MQPWVVALCAIRFDLEQGQLIEYSVPNNVLSSGEESHIAFSAFPDSSPVQHQAYRIGATQVHDSVYFFRIPREADSKLGGSFLYGYVFNRQRQDERLKRGGEQKSVVILSHLPCWSVFKTLVEITGPLFFDLGSEALVKISDVVSRWPPPSFGSSVELPVMNNMVIKADLPPFQALSPDLQRMLHPPRSLQEERPGSMKCQGIFHDVHLFGVLKGVLMQLWLLWELALIGEPLLILASNPSVSSLAVASVVGLIAPLPFTADFRPYFTIHDPGFQSLLASSGSEGFPSIIFGATNLHFRKSFPNFPNVLSLQVPTSVNQRQEQQQGRILQFLQRNRNNNSNNRNTGLSFQRQRSSQQQLWSSYVPVTKPDTSVLNKLVLDDSTVPPSPRMDESMSFVNTEILRKHFLELTNNFLAPLVPYLRAETPPRDCSPFVDPPPLPAFDADSFLTSLEERGPGKFLGKRLRSNWIDLYSRFLEGPNFLPWFQAKRAAAEREQQRSWRLARVKVDIRSLVIDMSELQLVDLFHAILRHLHVELRVNSSTAMICEKFRTDLRIVFSFLRKDMQQLLLSNPQHASLLQVQGSSLSRDTGNVKLPGRPSICITYPSEPGPGLPGLQSTYSLSGKLAQELAGDPLDLDKS